MSSVNLNNLSIEELKKLVKIEMRRLKNLNMKKKKRN